MDAGSNFGLRDLMLVTALAAFCFCVLFSPSAGWIGPLIFGVMVVIAVAVQRAIVSPANRPFWVSFLVGAFAYVLLTGLFDLFIEDDALTEYIGRPWWEKRYGLSRPYSSDPEFGAYVTFLFGLHIVFGASAAATAARVAQFVCRGSKPE
jgi:hypothetical protein